MTQPEGKLEPLADSAPCPCDSGKTHGSCCALDQSTRWNFFIFPDGRTAHVRVGQPKASLVRTVAPPYTEFLIRVVGLAMRAALRPGAAEYEGLIALLVTATALEA